MFAVTVGGSTASVSAAEDYISLIAFAPAGSANPTDSRLSTLNAATCALATVVVETNAAPAVFAAHPLG